MRRQSGCRQMAQPIRTPSRELEGLASAEGVREAIGGLLLGMGGIVFLLALFLSGKP